MQTNADDNIAVAAALLLAKGPTAANPITSTDPATGPIGINQFLTYKPATTAPRSPVSVFAGVLVDGAGDMSSGNAKACAYNANAALVGTRTGAVFGLFGYKGLVQKANTTGDLAWLVGCNIQTDNRAGAVTNHINFYGFSDVLGTATSSIVAGFYNEVPTIQAGATVTKLYGLFIDDLSGVGGTIGERWGVYVNGNTPSHFGGSVEAKTFIQTTGGAPATATSPGVAGQEAWDAGFHYRCIAANTWVRVALATW